MSGQLYRIRNADCGTNGTTMFLYTQLWGEELDKDGYYIPKLLCEEQWEKEPGEGWTWCNRLEGRGGIQRAVFDGDDTDPKFDELLETLWQKGSDSEIMVRKFDIPKQTTDIIIN